MKFDKEYSTSYVEEMKFLRDKGIRYTWVYMNEDKISVWKYKKEKRFGMFYLKCILNII